MQGREECIGWSLRKILKELQARKVYQKNDFAGRDRETEKEI
jgi:hypothetical protein